MAKNFNKNKNKDNEASEEKVSQILDSVGDDHSDPIQDAIDQAAPEQNETPAAPIKEKKENVKKHQHPKFDKFKKGNK